MGVCVCVCVCSDDEHMLIQHYCQSLNQGSPLSQPRSPAQILISMETEEKGELERVLNDLEQENRSVNPSFILSSSAAAAPVEHVRLLFTWKVGQQPVPSSSALCSGTKSSRKTS